jgi:hypothetical protein
MGLLRIARATIICAQAGDILSFGLTPYPDPAPSALMAAKVGNEFPRWSHCRKRWRSPKDLQWHWCRRLPRWWVFPERPPPVGKLLVQVPIVVVTSYLWSWWCLFVNGRGGALLFMTWWCLFVNGRGGAFLLMVVVVPYCRFRKMTKSRKVEY